MEILFSNVLVLEDNSLYRLLSFQDKKKTRYELMEYNGTTTDMYWLFITSTSLCSVEKYQFSCIPILAYQHYKANRIYVNKSNVEYCVQPVIP